MGRTHLPVVASTGVPPHGSSTPLPPMHARWLDAMLGAPTPAEVDATCGDCVNAKPPPTGVSWDPHGRCCTYLPHLPNFLLGGALTDDAVLGRAGVEARIAAREGISPLGAGWTRAFAEAWETKETWFGRDVAMRCPHYVEDGDLCGIWKYRNGVCGAYFCRTVRHGHGRSFWHATRDLFCTVERDLSQWCLRELGVAADDWGTWAGREQELYRACFALVAPLEWPDVVARCRPLDAEIDALRALHATLIHPRIPLVLTLAAVRYAPTPGDPSLETLILDDRDASIIVDDDMKRVLTRFDGRRATSIITRELRDEGIVVRRATLQRLVDLGILVAP